MNVLLGPKKHAKKSTANLPIVPEPLQDRKKQTDEERDLLPPCSCQRVCAERISEEDRNQIRINFWSKSYGERRIWLLQHSMGVKRRRSDSLGRNEDNQFRKKTSRTYTLGTAKVCKVMFMHTLGYKSDKFIEVAMKSCSVESRGKHDHSYHSLTEDRPFFNYNFYVRFLCKICEKLFIILSNAEKNEHFLRKIRP